MPIYRKPVINQWYQHLDKGYPFQVTAFDDIDDTVEVQHFDGDLEEIDLPDWYALDIEPIATPEDWTGPMDTIRGDDLGYRDTGMRQADWEAPLQEQHALEEEQSERRLEAREEE